jgi:hypothetical protein
MARSFDHRVCQVQNARVTFVNGDWQGSRPAAAERVDDSLQACPFEWDYLRDAGADGWQLVAVAQGIGGDAQARILYLQRERD